MEHSFNTMYFSLLYSKYKINPQSNKKNVFCATWYPYRVCGVSKQRFKNMCIYEVQVNFGELLKPCLTPCPGTPWWRSSVMRQGGSMPSSRAGSGGSSAWQVWISEASRKYSTLCIHLGLGLVGLRYAPLIEWLSGSSVGNLTREVSTVAEGLKPVQADHNSS